MLDYYPAILAAIIASSSGNMPPVADPGESSRILAGTSITLDGSSSSDDKAITSYQWLENGIVINTNAVFNLSFSQGTHHLMLKVTDDEGLSDIRPVTITALAQNEFDDENDLYGKNNKRKQSRDTLLTNLAARRIAERQSAAQDYAVQQASVQDTIAVAQERILPLKPNSIPAAEISLVQKTNTFIPMTAEIFNLDEVELVNRNGTIYLVNKTPRVFFNLVGSYSDQNGQTQFVKLIFDDVIDSFSEYQLSNFNNDNEMSIVNVAPLFQPQISFQRHYADADYDSPTSEEKRAYLQQLASYKLMNNNIHTFRIFNDLIDTKAYLGYDFSWTWFDVPPAQAGDTYFSELYEAPDPYEYGYQKLYKVMMPLAYRLDQQVLISTTIIANGTGDYQGYGRGWAMTSVNRANIGNFYASYRSVWTTTTTYFHEMMHNYTYTHESAMTHGYSDAFGSVIYFLYGKDHVVETVPEYVFDTQQLSANQYKVTVYKTGVSDETYFKLGFYSDTDMQIKVTKTARPDSFIVETQNGYSPEHILRVLSYDSNQVMSRIMN